MNSVAVLLAAFAASQTLGVWQPCGTIPSTQCLAFNFSTLVGTPAVDVGLPSGAVGVWRVADSTLFEESRTHNATDDDTDTNFCVRQPGVVRNIVPPFPLEDQAFEARVKVRITADGGGSAGIVFGDSPQGFHRFQINSRSPCLGAALNAYTNLSGLTNIVVPRWTTIDRNEWVELRVPFEPQIVFELEAFPQTPSSRFVMLDTSHQVRDQLPSGGTKLGLWCSSRGTTGGCEFKDFLVFQPSVKSSLVGQLDCHACNLQWPLGDPNWCRCCDQQCGTYTQEMCVENNFCASLCTSAKSCNGTTVATRFSTVTTTTTTTMRLTSSSISNSTAGAGTATVVGALTSASAKIGTGAGAAVAIIVAAATTLLH